jgi:hypothetical protein
MYKALVASKDGVKAVVFGISERGQAMMAPATKRNIQIALAIAIAVAAIRTGWILQSRHQSNKAAQAQKETPPPLNADYYVTPKKLHAYDLKSAKDLTKQPVWVKEGYRYTFYPYNPTTRRTDFDHEAGLLVPLQKIEVKDVVLDPLPGSKGKQVMALFDSDGKHYAVPVGTAQGNDYKIYADEMLFIQDPKELYKHWSSEVWESIEKHEVKLGMNELQADFAIGMGVPQRSDDADLKTVNYPNGGKPISVTYQNGKALEIKPSRPAS